MIVRLTGKLPCRKTVFDLKTHTIASAEDLTNADSISFSEDNEGVVLFKHSTRCSISQMALNRITSAWKDSDGFVFCYLDLLKHRNISDMISTKYGITHESPQLLLVRKGECIYNASHNAITYRELLSFKKG